MKAPFRATDALVQALLRGDVNSLFPASLRIRVTRPTLEHGLCDLDLQVLAADDKTVLANMPMVQNILHNETVTIVQALPKGHIIGINP